jgi:hypothetical protein
MDAQHSRNGLTTRLYIHYAASCVLQVTIMYAGRYALYDAVSALPVRAAPFGKTEYREPVLNRVKPPERFGARGGLPLWLAWRHPGGSKASVLGRQPAGYRGGELLKGPRPDTMR